MKLFKKMVFGLMFAIGLMNGLSVHAQGLQQLNNN